MFKRFKYKELIIILLALVVVLPLGKVNAIEIIYDEKEVKFVQSLFDNNGLVDSRATRDDMLTWNSILDWEIENQGDGKQLRKIRAFRLLGKKMTGTITIDANSGLDKLTSFNCSSNQLEKLEIKDLPLLESVSCYGNKLTDLKVTNTPNYIKLECWNNQLTDLTNAMPKKVLSCSNNPLGELDLSNATSLESLYCQNNQLNSLDIKMLDNLENLDCSNNRLTRLDFTNNLKLKTLQIGNGLMVGENYFETVDIRMLKDLETFVCLSAGLKDFKFEGLKKITQLNVGKNKLESLDISNLSELVGLQCYGNEIGGLNLKGLKKLKSVLCYGNQLKTLNLNDQINLGSLDCSSNQIHELILPDTDKLSSVNLEYNQLTALDLTKYNITVTDFFNDQNGIRGINNNPLNNFKIADKEYQAKINNGRIDILGYKYKTGEMTIKAVGDNKHKFKEWKLSSDIELINGDLTNDTITFILPSGTFTVEAIMENSDASLKSLSYQVGKGTPVALTDLNNQSHVITLPRTTKLDEIITITGEPTSDKAIIDQSNAIFNLEAGYGTGTLSVIPESGDKIDYYFTFEIESFLPNFNEDAQVEGILDGGTYQQRDEHNIEARVIDSKDGLSVRGDIRYIPRSWHLKEKPEINGSWSDAPYLLNFKDLELGNYTLIIEYKPQEYTYTDFGTYQWHDIEESVAQKEINFKVIESEYNLTVLSGSGSGYYHSGDQIRVIADKVANKEFDYWRINKGEGTLLDSKNSETTFIIGDSDVTIEAVYKDIKSDTVLPGDSDKPVINTGDENMNSWYALIFISLLGIVYNKKVKKMR